jgi:16S rRNA (guanine527-N7)-methyltransferase
MEASGLGAAAQARLLAFAALLTRWNPTIGLVSAQDIANLWPRHIEDALQLVPHMPAHASRAIDLGSGGGFPGLILALVTEVHFDLIEADSRKAAFLQEAVTITKASATVHARRIEGIGLKPRALVTARALAPLPKLLELSRPLLAEGGVCLFHKGQQTDSEVAEAREDWVMDLQRLPSRTSASGQILRISGLRRREGSLS